MATSSKNTNSYNRQNWETSDFPILCETCLGDNPYLRMTKEPYGKECKICERPFTVFRWKPGAKMRFKKTEVCQTCAKLKNACQTCLLDLEYGLPLQVRDQALGIDEAMPTSDVNREYYTQNQERALEAGGGLTPVGQLGKAQGLSKGRELLKKLARKTPYYKRNEAQICSFWVAGECKRGEECPYRHELPKDPTGPLAKQNMKDRYYGVNDPVAEAMMKRVADGESGKKGGKKGGGRGGQKALNPPQDQSVTSLYIGGVEEPFLTKTDLKDHFYQFGEIRVINVLVKTKAAIVHYTTREAAEKAARSISSNTPLVLKGRKVRVMWGRSRSGMGGGPGQTGGLSGVPPLDVAPSPMVLGAPGQGFGAAAPPGSFALPPPPAGAAGGGPAQARGGGGFRPGFYPSQDPQRMGARAPNAQQGAIPGNYGGGGGGGGGGGHRGPPPGRH